MERRLAPYVARTEPYGFQHLLGRADWEADAVRDELRGSGLDLLRDPDAVLGIDATGFLKKGRHSAGVARHYSGPAGRIANCQLGVFLGYASRLGHALRERERYVPKEGMDDRARCRQAGLPNARGCATTPPRAHQMLARAWGAGVPATGVAGDRVYGADRRLRLGLEAQPQASVLAVSGQADVWLGWRQRRVNTILASLPAAGWTRRRAGEGAKGPRWDDWRWLPLADPVQPDWRR
jgi:SRSO17 transposase